jgi:peptide/nickel transport system substrate-binding protein
MIRNMTMLWARVPKPGLVVLTSLALLAAACSSSSSSSSSPTTSGPTVGGTLTFATEAEACGLVPGGCMNSYSGADVEFALFDPLTVINSSSQAVPYLAKSVTPNADFTQWTIVLRPGVRFDDGSTLTASDLQQDYTQYFAQPTSADYGTFIDIKSIQVVNSLTATFVLAAADSQFPTVLTSFFPFNPDVKAKYGADWQAHPDGTGPFELVTWSQGNETVLKRNPHYWLKGPNGQQLPYLNELIFKPITDDTTRVATLQSGGVDGMLSEVPMTLQSASAVPGVTILDSGGNGGYGLFFNAMQAPVNDARVRLALAHATNVAAMLAVSGGGTFNQLRDQYYPPGSPWYSSAVASGWPAYNVAEAKTLLNEYVTDPHRSDGKPAGSPVTLTINYEPGSPQQLAVVQLAQQEWKQIGVQVTLRPEDEATLVGNALKGAFQVNYFEWGNELPYDLFHHNYLPRPANLTNFTLFNNAAIIQQIGVLQTATSQAVIKAAVQKIGMVLDQNAPLIFIGSAPAAWAVNTTKVGGAAIISPLLASIGWATIWAK